MTDMNEIQQHHELAWAKLPLDIREAAVRRLRAIYKPAFFEEIAKLAEGNLGDWLPPFWHFDQGMSVRNYLRSDYGLSRNERKQIPPPIPDASLPSLSELYAGEGYDGNWDDYYVAVLECAAGVRPLQ